MHVHALYRHGTSSVHRAAPHIKIVAAFGFVTAVVATPREAVWAFAAHLAALVGVTAWAGLRVRFLATRMLVEIPFLVAAATLPFLAGGESIDVLGIALSESGLWDAWNITAKATLGLMTSVILAATTEVPDLLRGLDTLRVPRVITGIMGFVVRYLDVIVGSLRRMRVAMTSRAYRPRWLGDLGPGGHGLGHLFVRSYERGERVYLAMVSRGFTGRIPHQEAEPATAASWAVGLALPAAAWALVATALVVA